MQPWVLDLADPRAPSVEQWAAMSSLERARAVDALPSEVPRATPPEGDPHRIPKEAARSVLDDHFKRIGRRVYLSAELPVYYPSERMFAPDVIAVVDVEPHERKRWVVSDEQRGLDLALEITLEGDRKKDLEENVERFARLQIPEYFVLDLRQRRLLGWRLEPGRPTYSPIVPQGGRWASAVLGLDLALEGGRLRFYVGSALLLEAPELIGRLTRLVDEGVARENLLAQELEAARNALEQQTARAEEGARRAKEEARRAEEEARRAERLADMLRKLGVNPDETG